MKMKNIKRIAAIALAAVLMLSLAGCSASDYKAAGELYQNGDFKAASEKYAALGDYKDSAALAVDSDYMYARELYYAGAYEAAAEAFIALGDYSDSKDMKTECVYNLAVETFKAEKYADAIEIFLEVEDYKDSEDYITKAREAIIRQSVLGEWQCEQDLSEEYTEAFSDGFALTNDSDPSEYFDFSGYSVRFLLTLNEDNTYTLDIDKAAYDESLAKLGEELKKGMAKMIEDMLMEEAEAYGYTMNTLLAELGAGSVEELIDLVFRSEFGLDLDGFVETVMAAANAENEYADYPKTGSFTVSGTTVTLTEDEITAEYNAVLELLTATVPVSGSIFQTLEFTR